MVAIKISAKGPSQRQLRSGEQIRHVIAEVLARGELHDPDLVRHIITVSEVRMSPDLRNALVLVMPLGGTDRTGDQGESEAIAALNRNAKALRHEVSSRLRALKFSPELRFRRDDRYDEAARIDRLFAESKVRQDLAAPRAADKAPDDDKA